MVIGGITPVTTVDYPGYLSCVIFVQGCPLRCRFCHNQHLGEFKRKTEYSEESVIETLRERVGFCDAVVISGGEPYSQPDLMDFMLRVKEMGYRLAVHTSGYYYDHFIKTFPILDWVGFDAKCVFADYKILVGVDCGHLVRQSLSALLESGIDYEIRTTVDPYYFTPERLLALGEELCEMGVKHYVLQEYREILKNERHALFSDIATNDVIDKLIVKFQKFEVRRIND